MPQRASRYAPYLPMARWPRLYHEILAPLFARRLYWQRFADQPRIALVVLSAGGGNVLAYTTFKAGTNRAWTK
jgi:hypothetical protein